MVEQLAGASYTALFVTIAVLHQSARVAVFLSTSPNRCSPSPGDRKMPIPAWFCTLLR
jgi:hypothetical protein